MEATNPWLLINQPSLIERPRGPILGFAEVFCPGLGRDTIGSMKPDNALVYALKMAALRGVREDVGGKS